MLASLGNQLQDDPLCPRRLHHQEYVHLKHIWEDIFHFDIIRKGELITELCFVVAGSLEVVQDGEILAFLGRLSKPFLFLPTRCNISSVLVCQDRSYSFYLGFIVHQNSKMAL